MDTWTAGKVARIREPIEAQYADVRGEIEDLTSKRRKKAGVNTATSYTMFTSAALSVVLVGAYIGQDVLQLSDETAASILLLLAVVVGALFVMPLIRARHGLDETEDERISMRIRALEGESQRLDVLRRADVKTLMLHAQQQRS